MTSLLTTPELQTILARGEGQFVEFKSAWDRSTTPSRASLASPRRIARVPGGGDRDRVRTPPQRGHAHDQYHMDISTVIQVMDVTLANMNGRGSPNA